MWFETKGKNIPFFLWKTKGKNMNQTCSGISWSSWQSVKKCNLMILITPTTTAVLCLCSQKGLFGKQKAGSHGQINCRAGEPRSSRVLEHSSSSSPHLAKQSPRNSFDPTITHGVKKRHSFSRRIKNSQARAERFMLAEQAFLFLQRTQHCSADKIEESNGSSKNSSKA